jgi:hypothetical protein
MKKQWKITTTRQDGITTTRVEEISKPENQQQIAILAYKFWQTRGCPEGTPEEDWFRAKQEIVTTKGMEQKAS